MTDYRLTLAKAWGLEIEQIEARLPLFDGGQMRVLHNHVDVTDEHVAWLKRSIEELKKGVAILESEEPTN